MTETTEQQEPRVGDRRPGGRANRVRTAVLRAAAELLDEVGYDALTYDEVAARADVHRTTVYRRWPTKPELVADAVDLHSEEHVPIPDTGTLRGDLGALAESVAINIGSEGGGRRSRSIVAAAATSEQLADVIHAFMSRRVDLTETVVTRAIERGDVAADRDPRVIVETVVAPIWFRLLLTGEPIDDDFVASVVALVSAGASAHDRSS